MSTESDSPPPQNPTPSPVTSKRPQPVAWAHQETVHLIQVYQDKWYASKRGPLKANQWEEVAVHVALLCGHPSKSALQCRHKMEKLRKRFREEKRRLSSSASSSFWPYYYFMDALERGAPLDLPSGPALAVPPVGVNYHYANPSGGYLFDPKYGGYGEEEEEEDDEVVMEDRYYDGFRAKSRSINYIIREPVVVGSGESSGGGGKRKREERGGAGLRVLVAEIRGVAERIVGVEREKLEMVKEMERWKMEMENKRMEMILGSQRMLVGLITNVFGEQRQQHKMKVEDGGILKVAITTDHHPLP